MNKILFSVLKRVLTQRTFNISSTIDVKLDPENVMDSDQKTFVHSADVGKDDFTPYSTLNITFIGWDSQTSIFLFSYDFEEINHKNMNHGIFGDNSIWGGMG